MAKREKAVKVLTPEEKLEQALVPVEEQPYKVPGNWCWIPQTEVCRLTNGETIENAEYPYLDVKYLRGNKKAAMVSTGKFISSETKVILVDGENSGEIFTTFEDGYMGSTFKALEISSVVSSNYFLHYVTTKKELYRNNKKGSAIPHLNKELFLAMPFPLPPLQEQHRIVLAIENLFSKLDEAKEKAQEVLDGFELRKSAILHKAFTGELTERWRKENGVEKESWAVKPLWEIGEIITGSTPSTKHSEYYHGDVPFIKPTELNQGRFVSKSQETLSKAGKMVSRPVRAGSTCICCIGATISKCGFLLMDSVTNQQINTIMPYHFMNDLYVFYFCSSSEFKQTVIENSSATTLPIINKNKISKLEIPVPMKKEQEKIVLVLENLISKEHQAKAAAESVLAQIDTMKKAILARAFRGELGTNDPAEEWAGEMVKTLL